MPFEHICLAHVSLREKNHDQSPWAIQWYFAEKPQLQDLKQKAALGFELCQLNETALGDPSWTIEEVPADIDWLEHSYQQFQPFSIGEFFVYGSHYDGEVPRAQYGLQIDAATAFGSGEHGTTAGCLEAMQDLNTDGVCPWNVLDMGTGSGILAIAAHKLWKTPVFAVDNDPESINVTQRHAKANKVPLSKAELFCAVNDGFEGEIVKKRGPFDLIIANILAGALIEMADDLVDVADDNAYIILSGILKTQAQSVLDRYQPLGLTLKKTYDIGEWSTLVMHKP